MESVWVAGGGYAPGSYVAAQRAIGAGYVDKNVVLG